MGAPDSWRGATSTGAPTRFPVRQVDLGRRDNHLRPHRRIGRNGCWIPALVTGIFFTVYGIAKFNEWQDRRAIAKHDDDSQNRPQP